MRFYRVVYCNSQKGTEYGWFLSKREARAEARKFLRAFHADPGASIKIQAVDISGTRQGVHTALQKFASASHTTTNSTERSWHAPGILSPAPGAGFRPQTPD
jgi:hypothetical protein